MATVYADTMSQLFAASLTAGPHGDTSEVGPCCVLLQPTRIPTSLLIRAYEVLGQYTGVSWQSAQDVQFYVQFYRRHSNSLDFFWSCYGLLAAAHHCSPDELRAELDVGFTKDQRRAAKYGTTALATLLSTASGRAALLQYVQRPLFLWDAFKKGVDTSVLCSADLLCSYLALPTDVRDAQPRWKENAPTPLRRPLPPTVAVPVAASEPAVLHDRVAVEPTLSLVALGAAPLASHASRSDPDAATEQLPAAAETPVALPTAPRSPPAAARNTADDAAEPPVALPTAPLAWPQEQPSAATEQPIVSPLASLPSPAAAHNAADDPAEPPVAPPTASRASPAAVIELLNALPAAPPSPSAAFRIAAGDIAEPPVAPPTAPLVSSVAAVEDAADDDVPEHQGEEQAEAVQDVAMEVEQGERREDPIDVEMDYAQPAVRRSARPSSADENRRSGNEVQRLIDSWLRAPLLERQPDCELWLSQGRAPLSADDFPSARPPSDDVCAFCRVSDGDDWVSYGCTCNRPYHRACIASFIASDTTGKSRSCAVCSGELDPGAAAAMAASSAEAETAAAAGAEVAAVAAAAAAAAADAEAAASKEAAAAAAAEAAAAAAAKTAQAAAAPRLRLREESEHKQSAAKRQRRKQQEALSRRGLPPNRSWEGLFPRQPAHPARQPVVDTNAIVRNILQLAASNRNGKQKFDTLLQQLKLNLSVPDYDYVIEELTRECVARHRRFRQRSVPGFKEAALYQALVGATPIEYSHIDLLCGTGMFSVAFEQAATEYLCAKGVPARVLQAATVLYLDQDNAAVETCRLNFPAEVRKASLDGSFAVPTLPCATVVSCGIICKDMASRNNRRQPDEEKQESEESEESDQESQQRDDDDGMQPPVLKERTTKVIDTLLRLAGAENRPRCFVIECGPNLVEREPFKTYWDNTMARFKELDYHGGYRVYSAAEFGLEQGRRRMVAVLFNGSDAGWRWPEPPPPRSDLSFIPMLDSHAELVGHTCWLDKNEKGEPEVAPLLPEQQLYVRDTGALFSFGEKNPIRAGVRARLNLRDAPFLMPTITEAWSNARSNRPVVLDGPTKETARWRYLTAAELARMQGIPSWFRFWQNPQPRHSRHTDENRAVKLIGNAVPVPMFRAVMRAVLETFVAQDGTPLPLPMPDEEREEEVESLLSVLNLQEATSAASTA